MREEGTSLRHRRICIYAQPSRHRMRRLSGEDVVYRRGSAGPQRASARGYVSYREAIEPYLSLSLSLSLSPSVDDLSLSPRSDFHKGK